MAKSLFKMRHPEYAITFEVVGENDRLYTRLMNLGAMEAATGRSPALFTLFIGEQLKAQTSIDIKSGEYRIEGVFTDEQFREAHVQFHYRLVECENCTLYRTAIRKYTPDDFELVCVDCGHRARLSGDDAAPTLNAFLPTEPRGAPLHKLRVLASTPRLAPAKNDTDSAGYALFNETAFTLTPGCRAVIDTGIQLTLPEYHYGHLTNLPSLLRRKIEVAPMVVDGAFGSWQSVQVVMHNHGNEAHFARFSPIAKLTIQRYTDVEIAYDGRANEEPAVDDLITKTANLVITDSHV